MKGGYMTNLEKATWLNELNRLGSKTDRNAFVKFIESSSFLSKDEKRYSIYKYDKQHKVGG